MATTPTTAATIEQQGLPEVEREFINLIREWRASIRPSTSLQEALVQPAYQRIIALGKRASRPTLMLILRDLQKADHHWFAALREITGEDPAADEDTFTGARAAWL